MDEIDHTYWFLSRAAGIVAYLLLFASVSFGLAMTGTLVERWLRRYRLYDLHRYLSLVTLAMTLFHAVIVLPDRYIRFTPVELFLPMASPYRPEFMALGVIGLYVLGAVILSFYLRGLISYRGWRIIHYATFGVFVLALLDGIGAGTDTSAAWVQYMYAVTGVIVFNLGVYRVLKGSARGIPAPPAPTEAALPSGLLPSGEG
jgi:predicted ferric reductase